MAAKWHETDLGNVVTLQRGFDLPIQERSEGYVPIVSSSGVTGTHSKSMVSAPGVITGRYGTIGEVFYLERDFWPLNTTLFVKDFKGNDPRFVYYLLKTLDFQSCSDKSSVPGVNRNHLHRLRVSVPALIAEQRAIAHILATLDDKIESNRRMNQTLEEIALATFKSWFVDFDPVRAKAEGRQPSVMDADTAALFPDSFDDSPIGKIPKGWIVGPILDRAKLLSGGTPKTQREDYWNGTVLWASAKDISQCRDTFLLHTERSITERGLAESATQVIAQFCTVVVARGATTGRMVLLGRDMAMNQTCYALASTSKTPFWLYCMLRDEIENLVHAAHGSVFDTITTSTFESSQVILPPQPVLNAFEAEVGPLFRCLLANTMQTSNLAAIRDALLPKLISGALSVKAVENTVGARR